MDFKEHIKRYDKSNMLELLLTFPEQFKQAVEIGYSFDFKVDPKKIKQVVYAGMGGSAIGGDLIFSCLDNNMAIPTFVSRNYFLPAFVDQNSLVIVSSFSGNTEESLSSYEDARGRNAQILCITGGGELEQKAKQDNVPVIHISGKMQPRAALGYLSIPVLIALIKLGYATLDRADFRETLTLLQSKAALYDPKNENNLAANIAKEIHGKLPVIYCTNNLLPVVANRWKCQISENAKMQAFFNVFPELNHNEIVGWEQPADLMKNFQIIYLKDKSDFSRNQNRMAITKDILEQITNSIIEVNSEGNSQLARLFSLIYLGDMVSFYLAMLNKVDPTPIDKIQKLKDQLKIIA
ncbi:bifunctional phosphoglucose/phosphomannose isomerase [candidate division KSB1 bacterium]|nr:bifunctional phosphoglucose/phosphomannose isomerase [candidate division KSB1 bacterium]